MGSGIALLKHPALCGNTSLTIAVGRRIRVSIRTPMAVRALSKSFEKMLSRSWIRNRYGCSSASASRCSSPQVGFSTASIVTLPTAT